MVSTLFLITASLLAQTQDTSAASRSAVPDVAAEVKKLIIQLDDRSLSTRDAAEKRLTELGAEVLPLLPTITLRTPAETKERLGRVRKVLETALSEANSRPTEVTMTGEIPLTDAFRDITKQTGNKAAGYDRRSGTVQLAWDKVPFWQAFDQLLDQAGFDINPYGGEPNTLVLVARGDAMAPRVGRAAYSGVFRFEPVRVESRRDLRNPAVNALRVTVEVTWEPRITPVSLRQPIDKIVAVDEHGQTLTVGGADSDPVLTATAETGMSAVELGIPLGLPTRGAAKIKSLQGSLTALVPGRLESFEFTDIDAARDVEQRRAGVAVILERVRQNGDLYEVRVRVRYDEAANALETHRGWVYANPAFLVNAKGERLDSLGANEGGRDENEIGMVLLFDLPDGPKGCKFVYQTPATMLQLTVPYELKDIELP